jgi:hypothetical protein
LLRLSAACITTGLTIGAASISKTFPLISFFQKTGASGRWG